MVMYDNELETKGNKIQAQDKSEPRQAICVSVVEKNIPIPYKTKHSES